MAIYGAEKRCARCFATKAIGEFSPYWQNRVFYRQSWCRECANAVKRERNRSPEIKLQRNESHRKWYHAMKADPDRSRYKRRYAQRSLAYLRARRRLLALYGGICECCGEATPEFLNLDHINGNGKLDRKASGGATALIWKLSKLPRQPGYRLLCYNCNCARAFNKGICPHEAIEATTTELRKVMMNLLGKVEI